MIKDKKEMDRSVQIDLAGPQGNAFSLLGMARQLGRQIGQTHSQIDTIQKDMSSGDYEHLIQVFEKHFGHIVTLYR